MNLFWSLEISSIESSVPWSIASSLYNANLGQRIQNHFCGKVRLASKLCKKFLPMLEFPIKLFWNLQKALIKSSVRLNVGKRLKNAKFIRRIQNHFLWEGKANVEPSRKVSKYIEVFYKFTLKSVKSVNRIFWAIEHWFKPF